jgi:hypothetical protein
MGNPSEMDERTKKQILADLNRSTSQKDETDYGMGLPDPMDKWYDEADVFVDRFCLRRIPTFR